MPGVPDEVAETLRQSLADLLGVLDEPQPAGPLG